MAAPWDRRPTGDQARIRDLQLGTWLPQATAYAAHWSEVCARVGLDPAAADSLDDLRRFPSSRELELLDAAGPAGAALVMRPTDRQVKALAETSTLRSVARAMRREGDSGRRRVLLEEYKPVHVHQRPGPAPALPVAYTRSDLDRLHRTGARAARVIGLDDADYLVNALPADPTLPWWGTYHLALGASLLAVHPRGAGTDLGAVADAFGLMPVTAVAVATDEAIELAAVLLERGVDLARVAMVVAVGPPPAPDHRAEIGAAWRASGAAGDLAVRALWAPSAGRALWAECGDPAGGLHTYPDLEHLEVLEPLSGSPAESDGDLTLTSLGWHGTALVRLRTGTWVDALATEPCPGCGRTVPRIVGEVVPGAWTPTLAADDGHRAVDLRGVGHALDHAGLPAWRVVLRSGAAGDELVLEVGGELDDDRAAAIHREAAAAGGTAADRIEVVRDPALIEAQVQAAGSVFFDER